MCSDTSIISNASYVTSPAFAAGSTGTASCMCTARAVDQHRFRVVVDIEHAIFSSDNPCSERLRIFKIGKRNKEIISSCLPSVAIPLEHSLSVKKSQSYFTENTPSVHTGRLLYGLVFKVIFGLLAKMVILTLMNLRACVGKWQIVHWQYPYWTTKCSKLYSFNHASAFYRARWLAKLTWHV